jgi:hypothetical protein
MDARVGAPGDDEPDGLGQDPREGRLELALDRSQPRLRGPARERAAVVGDAETERAQTSSRKTISVESERRGPSFTIRV